MSESDVMTSPLDTAELRATTMAATQGKWQWFGDTKHHEVHLATTDRGRIFVMDFVRWGMTGAQPRFQVNLNGEPGSGVMQSLGDLSAKESPLGAKFEAAHRRHFTGIGHPDAAHIVAWSPSTALKVLDELERLRCERDEALADGVLSQHVCNIENDRVQLQADLANANARIAALEVALTEACDEAEKHGLHSHDLLVNPALRAKLVQLRALAARGCT